MDLLSNPAVLKRRYETAVQVDPARTGFHTITAVQALYRFRRYVRDSLRGDSKGRKIPRNNKRFMEAFGSDCDEVFTRLGFKYAVRRVS